MQHYPKQQKITQNTCILIFFCMFCVGGLAGCASNRTTAPAPIAGQTQKIRQKAVTFSVIGKGIAPQTGVTKGQAFLLSERAAILDGYRLLTEKLEGVYVNALSHTGMNTIEYDTINARVNSLLRGTKITNITHKEYGITEVTMQVRINFTAFDMVWWPEGLRENLVFSKNPFL